MTNLTEDLTPQQQDRVDNPADLVPARSYVGAIVSGVVLVLGAALAIWKAFQPLPTFESLTAFEAEVDDVRSVRSSRLRIADLFQDPIMRYDVRFIGRSARYHYAAVGPKSALVSGLRSGDRVKAWSDIGKTYTIFQLERGGEKLVSFEEELDRVRSSRRLTLVLSTPLVLVGAIASFWIVGRLHYRSGTKWR